MTVKEIGKYIIECKKVTIISKGANTLYKMAEA